MVHEDAPDIYLVYGWRIGAEALRRALSDMTPEAVECGLRLVLEPDSKEAAFLGRILVKLEPKKGEIFREALPEPADPGPMVEAARTLGLELDGEKPKLWVVAG